MEMKITPCILRSSSCRRWLAGAVMLACSTGAAPLFAKGKDDVIVFKNGDKITGEIKKLANGVLFFRASYMVEAVQIDWAQVKRLGSSDQFHVFLTTGERLTGTIEEAPTSNPGSGDFTIVETGRTVHVRQPEVASLTPAEDTFWHQLTGSIDCGFGFISGNDATQSSVSGTAAYRTATSLTQLSGTSVFSSQSGAKPSGRNTLDFQYMKALDTHWYAGGLVDLLNSDQQDLTFRGSFGGGFGRDLVRDATKSFQVLGGLVFTREYYSVSSGGTPQVNNAEGVLRFNFQKQTFRTVLLQTQATVFPNITTPGRFRFGTEANVSFELVRNLFWKLSVYENYDTRPPVIAPKNDFGTSTSLGWKF